MDNKQFLTDFIKECSEAKPESTDEKFVGWEGLVGVLVGAGLKILLPELKEWMKLGASYISLKRQELKKKLIDYAKEKELDFPAAEKAAGVIADRVNEENLGEIINALEN